MHKKHPPGRLLFGTGAAQSLAPGHGYERLLHHHKATRHRWESAERSRNVQTDVLLPATFPSIERSACRYITAPLVATFTKQGAFCLFHESPLAKRHAPASQQIPSPPSLKEVSIAGTAGLDTLFLLHGRSGPLHIHPATRQRPADSGQVSSRLR